MIKLSETKQKEIALYFGGMLTNVISVNEELYEQKIPEYWQRYRGTWSSKKDKNYPWANSADFNLPVITWVCDSHISRTMDTIFGADDIFKAVAISTDAIESSSRIQSYINHILKKPEIFWNPIQQWVQRMYVEGNGILIPKYEYKTRKVKRYSKVGQTLNNFGMPTFSKMYQQAEGYLVPETKEIGEHCIEVYPIPLKDFFTNFNGDSVHTNEWTAYRIFKTKREIKEMGKIKDENLKWINTDKIDNMISEENKGTEMKDKNQAAGIDENITADIDKPIELFVIDAYYDYEGKGNSKHINLIINRNNNILFKICDNNDFSDKRRLILSNLFPVAGSLLGSGFPQRLGSMNDEYNTIHNQIIDNTTKINADVYTVIPKLLANPNQDLAGIASRPGAFIQVITHDAIKRLNNQIPQVNLQQMEMQTMSLIEKLAIITDTAMGRESNVERPTFRGKYLNLQEFLVNFGILMQQFQSGLKQLITHILEIMYQNMPSEGIEFSKNMTPDVKNPKDSQIEDYKITREDLEYFIDGKIELYVTVNSINMAKGIVEQKATILFDRLGNDQTGEINTAELKKFLIEVIYPQLKERVIRDPKEIQKLQEMADMLEQKAQIIKQKELQLMKSQIGQGNESVTGMNQQAPIQEQPPTDTGNETPPNQDIGGQGMGMGV
jgi:hypothetical protein